MTNDEEFIKDLEDVINRHSRENGSDTPDFILAEFLAFILEVFNRTSRQRDKWHGFDSRKVCKLDDGVIEGNRP